MQSRAPGEFDKFDINEFFEASGTGAQGTVQIQERRAEVAGQSSTMDTRPMRSSIEDRHTCGKLTTGVTVPQCFPGHALPSNWSGWRVIITFFAKVDSSS